MTVKECNECNIIKPISLFGKSSKGKLGVKSKCKECTMLYNKKYYIENKAKLNIINNNYYIENKGRLNELGRINKKQRYNNDYKYRDNILLRNQEYRCKKYSTSDGSVTINSVQDILDKQGGVCNYCGIDIFEREKRHLDHIYPIAKGGPHTIENVQWLCCNCNLVKSDNICE